MSRVRTPKVTQADIDRAVTLVERLGLKATAIEIEPGKVRILAGPRALTLPGDDAELEAELAEYRAAHGQN